MVLPSPFFYDKYRLRTQNFHFLSSSPPLFFNSFHSFYSSPERKKTFKEIIQAVFI